MKVYKFYWNFDDEIPSFEFKITKDVNYFFDKKEPENLRKQGYRNDGDPIGQKNGVGVPKKTDKIIRIRKIKK